MGLETTDNMKFSTFWLWLNVVLLMMFMVGAGLYGASEAEPVMFYKTRPSCATARAVDLPSSWSTPTKSGITVWLCE